MFEDLEKIFELQAEKFGFVFAECSFRALFVTFITDLTSKGDFHGEIGLRTNGL